MSFIFFFYEIPAQIFWSVDKRLEKKKEEAEIKQNIDHEMKTYEIFVLWMKSIKSDISFIYLFTASNENDFNLTKKKIILYTWIVRSDEHLHTWIVG